MKKITADEITYGLLYTGLVISEAELNRKELRAIARVTDTVEKFGKMQENGIFKLVLPEDDVKDESVKSSFTVEIEIEDYDFAVLNKVIGHVKWKPIAARHLLKLFNELDGGLKLED